MPFASLFICHDDVITTKFVLCFEFGKPQIVMIAPDETRSKSLERNKFGDMNLLFVEILKSCISGSLFKNSRTAKCNKYCVANQLSM